MEKQVQIGRKYIEFLSAIANRINLVRSGGYQEDPQVLLTPRKDPGKGRCCYDACPDKKIPADTGIITIHDRGYREYNPIHESCLKELLKDPRLSSPN